MNLNEYPLWTAVVTPMNEKNEVDYPALKNILNDQVSAKNGLLILGSTGEALNLSEKEKREVLEYAISLNLPSPIMVGVGGSDIEATKEWVKYLEGLNVHAYLMVVPLYSKPETKGQYYWFKELMDISTRPVMLYNVPGRTGKKLSFETVKMLKDHPMLWAIKEASGCASDFEMYTKSAPKAKVYSGDDALLPVFCKYGAAGLVSVASNVWPSQTHLYVKKCLDNSFNDENLWEECSNSLFKVSNPIPVKRLMADLKQIPHPNLKLPLSHEDLEDSSFLLESDKKINQWFEQNK